MKRLVLCFDGTWNSADSRGAETNVTRIARAVRANSGADGVTQITLYLRGVGSTGMAIQKLVDGATGEGVDDNIRSGYMFLAQNYEPTDEMGSADEIFIFGFSRGAFTARSLVGFISASGLLKRKDLGHLVDAWDFYRTEPYPRSPEKFCARHSLACHTGVKIKFLGVWDTVGSLGIPTTALGSLTRNEHQFHDTSPSSIVSVARHALAIDEYRDEFVPTLWTGTQPKEADIIQMWFAGAHSDVGGGYKNRALADIPLRWMAEEAEKAGLDLDWSDELLPATTDPLAPQHESRAGWSQKDRLTPTIRQIAGKAVSLGHLEWLYRPVDGQGNPLYVINEALHSSVLDRLGQSIAEYEGDVPSSNSPRLYNPKNVVLPIP